MKILAVSGSLRGDSHNTSLLRAAVEAAPEGVEVELWDGLADLPLYDQDLDTDDAARVRRAGSARSGARRTRSSSRRPSTTAPCRAG